MTWFKVKFFFENDDTKHLEYFVEASDIIDAEHKAFQKLGENGQKCKTGSEITPIVLNVTIGKEGKKYDSFKDQLSDDPKIIEISMMYLRGDQKVKDEIKKMLDEMFAPLGEQYQKQAISTLRMFASLGAVHDVQKFGKTKYLEEWLKECRKL